MTNNNCFCYGATDSVSFYGYPYGTWIATVNGVPTKIEITQRNSYSTLYSFFYSYKIDVSIIEGKLTFKNKSDEPYTISLENVSLVKELCEIDKESNTTVEVISSYHYKFCLAPKGIYSYTEYGYTEESSGITFKATFDPKTLFGIPDSSCYFPLQPLTQIERKLENDLDSLQDTNITLYFKNNNEEDTVVKISKVEGRGRFDKPEITQNNSSNIIAPTVFQTCLRGNACIPGIIDFSGALILADEVQGTIGSQKFFSTDQFIDQLSNLNLEVIELFEWEEPVEVPNISCENATNEAIVKEHDNSYVEYTVVINDLGFASVGGISLTGVLETLRGYLYNEGFTELYNALNYFSDSAYNVFILNFSSSLTIKISLIPTSIPPNSTALITEWLLPAAFNQNNSIVHDETTGEISLCLSPREPLDYVSFSGWFGEGWMNIHKYAIEVNGVLYEDPRSYNSADASLFVGSLQDVIDYNPEALYMLSTYSGSSGGVELYLTAPGTYNIRLIKQQSTFDWYSMYPDGNFLFVKEPEYVEGEYPTKDNDGNWSFTLYLQEEQYEEDNGVILS